VVHDLVDIQGKMKFGTYTLDLMVPPISFRDLDENPSERTANKINFTIMDPDEYRADTAQFIPNNVKHYTAQSFWKEDSEDGLDVYIDMIRHFPDNVTIVKLIAKVVDDKNTELYKPREIYPRLKDSTFMHQVYNVKLEVRSVEMSPTAMLHLQFMTVDATTLKEKVVGFSFFPLYINSQTRMPVQPEDDLDLHSGERALHKGCY
jgi:hypothetical protein